MERCAITIIYNGLHHLMHRGFTDFMVENFDHWVVVEGLARNGGSTRWMRPVRAPFTSIDGTVVYMHQLASHYPDRVHFFTNTKPFASKDEQFNKGLSMLKRLTGECFLWQVDADEHWSIQDITEAENRLKRSLCNVASFQFNHYVKEGIVAVGDWGSGRVNRLWKWKGQPFVTHEPARMQGQTASLELPQKFEHYSMVFDHDVRYKGKTYPGNEQVYPNWLKMDQWEYPCHISRLFGTTSKVGRSNTNLYKISQLCANAQNQEVAKEAAN